MNEADTRAKLIDPKLQAAGWVDGDGVVVLREYVISNGQMRGNGNRDKKKIADYVLRYNGVNLAVVEAKSDEVDAREGVEQAKSYAEKLSVDTSFATNGIDIYQMYHKKDEESEEDYVDAFPTPQELWNKSFGKESKANEWLKRFNAIPYDRSEHKETRYYQEIAVQRVMKAIADEQQRILLTLATGTGKTHIAFQIVWKLFQSRWNRQRDGNRRPRVLFLADRNILANQAFLVFAPFGEALARINPKEAKSQGVPTSENIFFTIYQTFMSGPEDSPYFGDYDPDFFDLVIIDECHRGGANDESAWRSILDHFSGAVHLGLTATPIRDDNVNTYDYFCEAVFTYSLQAGIEDGFLTPFKVRRIRTTIDNYIYSPDDDVEKGEVEEGHVYVEEDFNRKIEIRARERRRVQELLGTINQNEKTIVFCANQGHAGLVRDLINQEAESSNPHYCVRVTSNDGAEGDQFLSDFRDDEKTIPTILTTSRKLSTGVDVPDVRNIALMRPIRSMVEFKQIIGRGTRLSDDKNFFTIIDFVGASDLFNDPEWDGHPLPPDEPPSDVPPTDEPPTDEPPPLTPPPPPPPPDEIGEPRQMVRIRLSDNNERKIRSSTETMFEADGRWVNAESYIQYLFNQAKLPQLLKSEEALREMWAKPETRIGLLESLEKAGCTEENLRNLQQLIEPSDSDLFDVLAYIAYNREPVSRCVRAEMAIGEIDKTVKDERQRHFFRFVLRNYVELGVEELRPDNISTLLTTKYGSVPDAEKELGDAEAIRKHFIDFQRYLYQEAS